MALSNEIPANVLPMGMTPGLGHHQLLHAAPTLPAVAKTGYMVLRPQYNATLGLLSTATGAYGSSGLSGASTAGNTSASSATVLESPISHIYTLPWMVSVAVVLFLLVVVTIFGNFLVILALFKYRNLRSVSNYLIGNLAISDFLLSVTILPMSAVNQCLGYWVFGEILCQFWLVADVLYCTASIWNLCIIAFDRFTATLYPLWYREKRTVKQGIIYIVIVWVLSFAICVPPLLGWNDFTQSYIYSNATDTHSCMIFQFQGYVVYSASGSFFIPFFITLFMYIRIFGVLRHRIRKMRAAAAKRNKQAKAANKPRAADKPSSGGSGGAGAGGPQTTNKAGLVVASTNGSAENESEKGTQTIELSAVAAADGHAVAAVQPEEHSSRSLFGSDSQGENRSEEEEEDSSAHVRSDHPLYVSSSEAEVTTQVTKNGIPVPRGLPKSAAPDARTTSAADTATYTEPHVVVDANHSQNRPPVMANNDADHDHIQIVVTQENTHSVLVPNNNKPNNGGGAGAGQMKVSLKNRLLSVSKEALHRSDSDKTAARRSIANPLKHVNPFKKDRDKSRSSQKQKRFDQREVRATIRMAIIIAFFCGCWVGFFTIYVVRAFCPGCVIPNDLDAFLFWLGYSNSAMNPILYTIFNDDFRKAFQKLLGCHGPRGGASGSSARGVH